jgi:hypothetical protein
VLSVSILVSKARGCLRLSVVRATTLVTLTAIGLLHAAGPAIAAISYVQSNSASPNNSSLSSLTVTLSAAEAAGDLNVVAVGWGSTTVGISSVTDSQGNSYTLAIGPSATTSVGSTSIYYAPNIAAAAAGANTVTVTFSAAVPFPDVRVAEYSGISTTSPLDVTTVATGTGTTSSSGAVSTTNANDLLVGSNWVLSGTTGPGTGFTQRVISAWDGDILEDEIVSATGSYTATAPISPSAAWIMQMAAFKAASSGGDTTPPTAPSGLTATAASGSQINLSWTAPLITSGSPGTASSDVKEPVVRALHRSRRRLGRPTATPASLPPRATATASGPRMRPGISAPIRVRSVPPRSPRSPTFKATPQTPIPNRSRV